MMEYHYETMHIHSIIVKAMDFGAFERGESAYYWHCYGRNATLAIATDAKYVEEGEAWYQPIASVHELTLKRYGSMYMEQVSFKRMGV